MKVAVIYNRESRNVINLFGVPSREKYGVKAIRRITEALKKGGHHVQAFEGDKDLVRKLEDFMPSVLQGELPGMVFNLSYGIQGQARYTHVPGILEMLGVPYVGSGPLAHSLALDKVVAKMLFRQHGLPTPDFAVLKCPEDPLPDLTYPLIVKPKNESTSLGVAVVQNSAELAKAAQVIFDEFRQAVLVEQYIDGREINVGLLGNGPPEAFPAAELIFEGDGPRIYTMADKKHKSGRNVGVRCPTELAPGLEEQAQELARKAFQTLACVDCARVDFRLDDQGKLFILEINSLPSLGEHGSYTHAAKAVGLSFTDLINRLVEVASARYFGTPNPVPLRLGTEGQQKHDRTFIFITSRRDHIERRLQEWVEISSRTADPVGLRQAYQMVGRQLRDIGLREVSEGANDQAWKLWETGGGYEGGTLLVSHVDVPLPLKGIAHGFRREPEWVFGEGVGVSRAPLVMIEHALRVVRAHHLLSKLKLGVLIYGDEGQDCRYSADALGRACRRVKRVIALTPSIGGQIIVGHRGMRRYRLVVDGQPRRLGQTLKSPSPLSWVCDRLPKLMALSDRKGRVAVSASDLRTEAFPFLLPHRISLTLVIGYPTSDAAEALEEQVRKVLGKKELRWQLELISDRPPLQKRPANAKLAGKLIECAQLWQIPLEVETSVQPTAMGYVPDGVSAVCGLGPVTCDPCTPQERVRRISVVQRTLILAQFLVEHCQRVK